MSHLETTLAQPGPHLPDTLNEGSPFESMERAYTHTAQADSSPYDDSEHPIPLQSKNRGLPHVVLGPFFPSLCLLETSTALAAYPWHAEQILKKSL